MADEQPRRLDRWTLADKHALNRRAADVNRAVANAEYSSKGSSRTNGDVRQAVENYRAAVRQGNRHAENPARSSVEQAGRYRADQYAMENEARERRVPYEVIGRGQQRVESGQTVPVRFAIHAHSDPSEHIGTCDAACRRGEVGHAHRIPSNDPVLREQRRQRRMERSR
ncbi:MAG: hypothetical protein L3K23_10490 [Thermoplasmata archaeon]|nr:hypothetical protein [Thermoplasmata archaeon]